MRLLSDSFDRRVLGIACSLVLMIVGVVMLGDHVGAAIVNVSPAVNANPPTTTAIRITFAQPMDTTSVESHFVIEPPVGGHIEWAGNTFIFRPNKPLLPLIVYTATLSAEAVGLTGQRTLDTLRWRFTPRAARVLYLVMRDPNLFSLWAVPADGSAARELFAPPYGIHSFASSPDGAQIVLAVSGEKSRADLWLMNADGANTRQVLDCAPGICTNPTWSPDGKLIAYERQDFSPTGQLGLNRVWLLDVASGETVPALQDNQMLGFAPLWSPDSRRLAVYDPGVGGIRVLDRTSASLTLIPNLTGMMGSFSADGKAMVYTDARPVDQHGRTQLLIDWLDVPNGIGPLMVQSADDRAPSWSPDGTWIAFARRDLEPQAGLGSQLMVYHVPSGKVRQLTDETNYDYSDFQWDPNSQRILMQRLSLKATLTNSEWWLYDLSTNRFTRLVEGLQGRWLP